MRSFLLMLLIYDLGLKYYFLGYFFCLPDNDNTNIVNYVQRFYTQHVSSHYTLYKHQTLEQSNSQ